MDDSPKPHRVARYRFRTLGPPALLGAADDTTSLGQHGRRRDQLLLLFWPEATQSRARHSLDQLLYGLRNSLGESVFDGVNPVRLNPAVVSSDVAAFNAALETWRPRSSGGSIPRPVPRRFLRGRRAGVRAVGGVGACTACRRLRCARAVGSNRHGRRRPCERRALVASARVVQHSRPRPSLCRRFRFRVRTLCWPAEYVTAA